MRTLQRLNLNRARNLFPSMVQSFYVNLQHLYNKKQYQLINIWNVNELDANAFRDDVGNAFVSKRAKNVHTITSNEKEWISMFTTINTNDDTIFNYYIFKGMRIKKYYIALCEHRTTFDMQKRNWMDAYYFS